MGNCISPFRRRGETIDLPCGKCHECRARRTQGWAFRLMKEAEVSSSALFITLTYNEENVPWRDDKQSIEKDDLQRFMKRLRKLNRNKLKYYACGEYGGKTMRPHYHIILFNADPETIQPAWKINNQEIGNVHIGKVTEASVVYTLKYLNKPTKIKGDDIRQREFQLMSKGIGKNYLTEKMIQWHHRDLENRAYFTHKGGRKVSMPRYIKEKLYTEEQRKKIGKAMQERETEKWQKLDLSTKDKKWQEEIQICIEKTRKFQS
jgi:hypothetical protein